ncbi:MAG: TIGR02996 domain-containing protein [Myxococcaceae bacterium]|nr:TIGR02996 domain-containing protein [Myxococcaceae bacterium]
MMEPTERHLLDAVLAAPDDDGPRLVYADWLNARGDPRGELIVLQCALERDDLTAPEHVRVRSNQSRLFKAHLDLWERPLRALRDGRYTFRRGFAHHARLTGAAPLALEALHEVAPLLRHFTIAADRLAELMASDWVEGLQLENGLVDLQSVVRSLRLPRLRRLRLPAGLWEPADVEQLAAIDRPLEYLSLDFDQRSGAAHHGALKLGLSRRARLRALRIEGARGLGSVTVSGLEELELVRCEMTQADVLAMAPSLVKLEITESDLRRGRARFDPVAFLEVAPRLTSLRIEGAALDDAGLARLVSSPQASRLKHLHLARNALTDVGARALLGTEFLFGLRSLNLDVSSLTTAAKKRVRARFPDASVDAR